MGKKHPVSGKIFIPGCLTGKFLIGLKQIVHDGGKYAGISK